MRLDDDPGISGVPLGPLRRRSVHVRCVDTGMVRVGDCVFHPGRHFSYKRLPPDLRGLQEDAVLAGKARPGSEPAHRTVGSIPYFSSQSGRSSPATDHHARSEIHSMAFTIKVER